MSSLLFRVISRLKRLFGARPSEEDPYAYVRHPRNPRTPRMSSAIALEEPRE